MAATTEDLVQLASSGEAADFRDAVKELLTTRAQETIMGIAENYDPLDDAEELANEEGDEIDLNDEEEGEELDEEQAALVELASQFTVEELDAICDNMTEEEFEELDDLSKALLVAYIESSTEEEEVGE